MHNVKIIPVLNGWEVEVGCQKVVFSQVEMLLTELRSYLVDPEITVKRYQSESINSRFISNQAEAPPECNAAQEVRREPMGPVPLRNRI